MACFGLSKEKAGIIPPKLFNAKSKKMNDRVLKKMYEKGVITLEEYEGGRVSEERYDMFVAGVTVLENIEKTPQKQLEAYSGLITGEQDQEQTEIKGQVRKLEKLLKRKKYAKEDVYGGGIKLQEPKAETQRGEVRKHLQDFGSLTSWDAFKDYGITRLSAIIYNLRHEEGMEINSTNVTKRNRYGNIVNFAKYELKKD